jgi:cell division protein FtsQ
MPRRLRRVLPAGLAAALLLAGWPAARDVVRRHPYFAVREVVVRGQVRLAPDRIRRAAGIEPGMSVWAVDRAAAEARLRREPWIRTVRVERQLPHRVVIRVREERPVAILAVDPEPGLYYLAGHGRIVAALGPEDPRDFPYVTGLEAGVLGGDDAFGARAVRQALGLVRAAARRGGPGPVSEVHVDRARGLTLLPVRPGVPIEIGWGRFAVKLARLSPVLARWEGREAELAEVSLLFDDEVVVRVRPEPASGRARRPARA